MGCNTLIAAKNQPSVTKIITADGVETWQIEVFDKGDIIPQHAHTYEHATLLARGSIRAWKEDQLLGDFTAPTHIIIAANTKHNFQTLEDNVLLYCVHNASRKGEIEIDEENQIVGKLCLSA